MKIALWLSREIGMDERERRELCDQVVGQFNLSHTATYRDACRRVGEVMSERLGARVEIRFVVLRNTRLSGGTARLANGTYVVCCAKSQSWYHRLGILLHELAHLLLGHQPTALGPGKGVRHFAPHLPSKMARLVAERTTHTQYEEREAEEFADDLIGRLTEQQNLVEAVTPSEATPHVMRIAEGLGPVPRKR
ncbi:hypothetical protein ABZW18_18965 [Streptomyces sp. NPDC004647]|uniref:hypothetical protein n=1 Tax=Streptomyces sp. NPDC004647 TaxID=3154671 RepID=UPI0033A84C21